MTIPKQIARDLGPLVNDPMDFKSLADYANYRIEQAQKALERANVFEQVKYAQGQIYELRLLLGLQEEAKASVK